MLLEYDRVGLLLAHAFDFLLVLLFLGLLAHLEEVRVEDRMGVERMRVGVVVLVVRLVHPL